MRCVGALCVALSGALMGCEPEQPNATPEGAVRELLERFASVHGQPEQAHAVYEMLSKRTRDNLGERARRYSDASRKTIAPESMIAPSRFLRRFQPQEFTAEIVGTHALVEVVGLLPSQRARIPCVYEDGGWKVDIILPELAPVRLRPGAKPNTPEISE